MIRRRQSIWVLAFVVVILYLGGLQADEKGGHRGPSRSPAAAQPKSSVTTMKQLHKSGGVPPRWRFTFPNGDPKAGREVFVTLECYQCHAIRGEQFPNAFKGSQDSGPELTGMGSHHPVEYFAESILNPNAVIVTAPSYIETDGRSIMPDYRESLTAAQLIDVLSVDGHVVEGQFPFTLKGTP